MKELSFATGLVTYSLNGKYDLTFNPTDGTFIEKLFAAFDELDRRQEAYKAEVDATTDNRKVFEIARKMDTEMRGLIDEPLSPGLCDAVFGHMNVYALADGLPAWANLMLAVMEECETAFASEQKVSNPRIAKYTSKYKK